MTLIRPPRTRMSLEPEVEQVPELSIEQRILATVEGLDGKISSIEANSNIFRLIIMGDVEGETQHGRLPMVEGRVSGLEARMNKVEEQQQAWKNYLGAFTLVGMVLGYLLRLIWH